jgi:hypothetical protein
VPNSIRELFIYCEWERNMEELLGAFLNAFQEISLLNREKNVEIAVSPAEA